jgi:hypothetical protein
MVDQPGRAIGHAPGATTGAKAAALAAERQQMLGVAGLAAKAQKAVLQAAALQVAVERLSHMAGQLFAGLDQVFDKGRVMPLDELVEQRLLGPVALVAARRRACSGRSWRGLRGHVRPGKLYLYTVYQASLLLLRGRLACTTDSGRQLH